MSGDASGVASTRAGAASPSQRRSGGLWPYPSFDARDWAAEFCRIARKKGSTCEIDEDFEAWMFTWFANALMKGFDHHAEMQREKLDDGVRYQALVRVCAENPVAQQLWSELQVFLRLAEFDLDP